MIQRIQTIYLLIIVASIALLAGFNAPVYQVTGIDKWTGPTDGTVKVCYASRSKIPSQGETVTVPNNYLVYAMAASGLLAFVAIFMFKNRRMQLLLCAFNYLLFAAIGALIWLYIDEAKSWLFEIHSSNVNITLLVPALLPLWNYLAMRGIMKDEQLVKSMDRLR
jgi:hypothetical protein